MSDEMQEVTFEQALNMRLSARLGNAVTQIEALQIQLEMAQQRIAELEAKQPVAVPDSTPNGEHEHEGVAPV